MRANVIGLFFVENPALILRVIRVLRTKVVAHDPPSSILVDVPELARQFCRTVCRHTETLRPSKGNATLTSRCWSRAAIKANEDGK